MWPILQAKIHLMTHSIHAMIKTAMLLWHLTIHLDSSSLHFKHQQRVFSTNNYMMLVIVCNNLLFMILSSQVCTEMPNHNTRV